MSYSARLKQARRHAKLGQIELAKKSGVSQQTISKIERGLQDSSAYTVQLATACGVRPEWLATGQQPMAPGELHMPSSVKQPAPEYAELPEPAVDIARTWLKLSPAQQQRFKDQLFLEAAITEHYPWLIVGRPNGDSYEEFERKLPAGMQQNAHKLVKK
jgi:hypothetical protein